MPSILSSYRPDPKACAVARAVEEAIHPDRVILFGSRARGDFNADSDIDLLIITDAERRDKWEYVRHSEVAHRKSEEVYEHWVGVDLVHMSEDAFHYGRRARNHLAGQAVRDGFDANGDKVNYDNPEPTNWPDIRQRIVNAERELRVLNDLVEADSAQEAIGFHAQQAIENALKGWISALDADYGNTHDLGTLMAIIRRHPAENDTPAGERLTWLSKYAVAYRYEGAVVEMDDRFALLEGATETVHAIIDRIRALTGDKVNYDNPKPTNWPDIRQRIANAERYLTDMEVLVEDSRSSQEIIGFTAQQAIENALKGWISALDADYGNTHDLGALMAIVRRHPDESDTPAGERLTWLTEYAVAYRYEGAVVEMDDRFALLEGATETVHAIINRIRMLTGAGA